MNGQIQCDSPTLLTLGEKDNAESELVRSLRKQLHEVFLQINDSDKLRNLQIEHLRMDFEEREEEWRRKEQEYRKKIAQLQQKLKQQQHRASPGNFVLDLGDFDDSHIFQHIEPVEETLRDSAIFKLQQILTESQISPMIELQKRIQFARKLSVEIDIEGKVSNSKRSQLLKMCQDLSLQNCRIKEQLKNCLDEYDVMKCKIQEAYSLLNKYKTNQARLREQSTRLKDLYESEVERKQQAINNLIKLQEQAEKNQNECIKLQTIIRDQESRIEILSHQSILNENIEINDSRSRSQNQSGSANWSSMSHFLKRLDKTQNKADKPDKNDKQKPNAKIQQAGVSSATMFKKKPLPRQNKL